MIFRTTIQMILLVHIRTHILGFPGSSARNKGTLGSALGKQPRMMSTTQCLFYKGDETIPSKFEYKLKSLCLSN